MNPDVIYVLEKQLPAPLENEWEATGFFKSVQNAYQAFDRGHGHRRLRAQFDCFNGVKSYVVNQV